MSLFVFAWFILCQQLPLQQVDGQAEWGSTQIGPQGDFLAVSGRTLFHWNPDGTLQRKITARNGRNYIISFHYSDNGYYLSEITPGIETVFYDRNGQFRAVSDDLESFIINYIPVDASETLITRYGNNETLTQDPYVFLAWTFNPVIKGDRLHVNAKPFFGKATERQAKLAYDYLLLWVAKEGDGYVVVNQLAPRIHIYDKKNIAFERGEGTKKPTNMPGIELKLDKYKAPPDELFYITKPITRAEYIALRQKWVNSWSRITWFGKLGTGYVISYEIPNCTSADFESCHKTHLGIQRLSADFKPVGDLIETDGSMMGVNPSGKICVFEPNPIQQNGVRVGDRPTIHFF